MTRINRLTSDDVLLVQKVMGTGSFAAVAGLLGQTPSSVSRAVSRIEDKLGVRLLERSTRRLAPTPEGEALLAGGEAVLDALAGLEAEVTQGRGRPVGRLRVSITTALAQLVLAPHLPRFAAEFPEIRLDLQVSDRRADMLAERIDVAVRTGPLTDSALRARRIGMAHRVICASPAYLERAGTPAGPQDLDRHACLSILGHEGLARWSFDTGEVTIRPHLRADSAMMLRAMAIAGAGLVRLADFVVADALADGRLVAVLRDRHRAAPVPIHALTLPGPKPPPRVRAFVDFMAALLSAPAQERAHG